MAVTPAESLLGILVIAGLGLLAVKYNALTFSGLLAATLVGYVVLLGGGWSWLATLIAFFAVASRFTRFQYERKRQMGSAQEKGGARGWNNTFANGGIAAVFALLEYVYGGGLFAMGFLGAVSTAAADTLATEVGLTSSSPPRRPIPPFAKVPPGTSGGVTPLGEIAALGGSGIVGLVAGLTGAIPLALGTVLAVGLLSGLVGSALDSLLGATVQGVNRCQACGNVTEALSHCGTRTRLVKGIRIIENNMVNLLATTSGALFAMALYQQLVRLDLLV